MCGVHSRQAGKFKQIWSSHDDTHLAFLFENCDNITDNQRFGGGTQTVCYILLLTF